MGFGTQRFVGNRFVVRKEPAKVAFECVVHPPHGLFVRSIDFARPPYRIVSDEAGFNLFNQNGQITVLERGYVWVLGGPVRMGEGEFNLGPLAMLPYPVDRFMSRARAGEIERLVQELYAPLFRVQPKPQGQGWSVIAQDTGATISEEPTEARALERARSIARGVSGRVIHAPTSDVFTCLFENTERNARKRRRGRKG